MNSIECKLDSLSTILIAEASKKDNTIDDWLLIFDSIMPEIICTHGLRMRPKLAVAIVLVGSKSVAHFLHIVKILRFSEWGKVGGSFWVVQEELMRHAALFVIRNGFQREFSSDFNYCMVLKLLEETFPIPLPSYVTHQMTRKKLGMLKIEILQLVDEIRRSNTPWDSFVIYSAQFPLDSFVEWFLPWAQDLLIRSAEADHYCLRVSEFEKSRSGEPARCVSPISRPKATEDVRTHMGQQPKTAENSLKDRESAAKSHSNVQVAPDFTADLPSEIGAQQAISAPAIATPSPAPVPMASAPTYLMVTPFTTPSTKPPVARSLSLTDPSDSTAPQQNSSKHASALHMISTIGAGLWDMLAPPTVYTEHTSDSCGNVNE